MSTQDEIGSDLQPICSTSAATATAQVSSLKDTVGEEGCAGNTGGFEHFKRCSQLPGVLIKDI